MFHNVAQNTDHWFDLRLGRFTASSFAKLFMAPSTKGYNDCIYKVVYEIMNGETAEEEGFSSVYTDRGHALEPFAIEQYEINNFVEVEDGGFYTKGDRIGASPDGRMDNGRTGVEVKCPRYTNHFTYLSDGILPKLYQYQVHGQIWVCDFEYSDFISYHPNLPMFQLRVYRDEKIIKEIEHKVNEAIEKVSELLEKLT